MYIKNLKKNLAKRIMYLILTLTLSIFLSGCVEHPSIEFPTNYCETHDCTYCEKDSDCTAMPFYEEAGGCCQGLTISKHRAVNIESYDEIRKLESEWFNKHCSPTECIGTVSAPLLLPEVSCINNICIPSASHPSEICGGNICTWNASWIKEQEELLKKRMGL